MRSARHPPCQTVRVTRNLERAWRFDVVAFPPKGDSALGADYPRPRARRRDSVMTRGRAVASESRAFSSIVYPLAQVPADVRTSAELECETFRSAARFHPPALPDGGGEIGHRRIFSSFSATYPSCSRGGRTAQRLCALPGSGRDDDADGACLRSLRAILNFVLHLRPFGEALVPLAADRAVVDEDVLAPSSCVMKP
jgi:hypothetical protein